MEIGDRVIFLNEDNGVSTIEYINNNDVIVKSINGVVITNITNIDKVATEELSKLTNIYSDINVNDIIISNKGLKDVCDALETFTIVNIKYNTNKYEDIITIHSTTSDKIKRIKLRTYYDNFIIYDEEKESMLGNEILFENKNYFLPNSRVIVSEIGYGIIYSFSEGNIEVYNMDGELYLCSPNEVNIIKNQEELLKFNPHNFIYKDLIGKEFYINDDKYIVNDINSIFINSLEDLFIVINLTTNEKSSITFNKLREVL